ncbi:MAG: hypothetical protein SNJ57_09245 [Cyanobacteriota bacterium]
MAQKISFLEMAEFVEKFPLVPDAALEKRLLEWLETCRKVWNAGLVALLELEASTAPVKILDQETGKQRWAAFPSCRFAVRGQGPPRPVATGWFKNQLTDKNGNALEPVWAEHCWILPKSRKGGTVDLWTGEASHAIAPNLIRVGQCCPLPIAEWREPRLGLQIPGKYSLQYFFTQANVRKEYPYLADEFEQVPAWFIRGVCDSLWQAWSRYKSGTAGEPRFKRFSDPITSLTYADAIKLRLRFNEQNPKDGTIAIPKLGRKADKKGNLKVVPGVLPVVDLAKRFTVETEDGKVLRSPSIARIVHLPDGNWQLHLTAFEPTSGEIDNLAKLAIAIGCHATLTPLARLYVLLNPWWRSKRHQDCTLTVPGENYVVAVDDRGWGYSVLPKRHTDGAIDPHHLIATLDRQIEELQRQISWKEECSKRHNTPRQSNRLKEQKRQKRKLQARRAAILRSNRQKVAHFIAERSRDLTVIHKPAARIRKPKRKLKEGTNPAKFEPNGAGVVAETNKIAANAAPGEFIALIKRYAEQRGQKLSVKEEKKTSQKSKKSR